MRYQFYREHKFVSSALNDLEREIAKADFRKDEEFKHLLNSFQNLSNMLKGHAEYENEHLHALLKKKKSPLYKHVEEDHAHQEEQLLYIQTLFDTLAHAPSEEKVSLGYQLYLTYRKFVADNLSHLHEEETQILPELQRLYSDEELSLVEAPNYQVMTPGDMVDMVTVLFSHMNSSDRLAILTDMHHLQPEKLALAWERIASILPQEERGFIEEKLLV